MTFPRNTETGHDHTSVEVGAPPFNADRVSTVYDQLGKVLENPVSYGLGERLPQLFMDTLTAMRENLKAEMAETGPDYDDDLLQTELSQDSDSASRSAASPRTAI